MPKADPSRNAPEEVDAYLAGLPEDKGASLEQVRSIIRRAVPDCTERISYRIPIFRLQKDLVGMSAQKKHCSLHSMSPQLVRTMSAELKGVKVSGATIHFTPEEPLPADLIEAIIAKRIEEIVST